MLCTVEAVVATSLGFPVFRRVVHVSQVLITFSSVIRKKMNNLLIECFVPFNRKVTVSIVDYCLHLWIRVGNLWDQKLLSPSCRFVCIRGIIKNVKDLTALLSSCGIIWRACQQRQQQAVMCNYEHFLAHLSNRGNWGGCMFLLIWLP